jgi:hypothetical protein
MALAVLAADAVQLCALYPGKVAATGMYHQEPCKKNIMGMQAVR